MFLGLYESSPTRLVGEYLRPGMIVVDVGANVGYYTLLALSRVGQRGHVIAIEPASRPRRRLEAAVEGVPNVTILACALGAKRSTGTLYLDREADNDTPTMVPNHGGVPQEVTIVRLDECLAELGFDHIDLLKLDVEGWEPEILNGASSLLADGRIGAMLCELNDYWLQAVGTNAAALHQQILEYGFHDVTPGAVTRFETRLFVREKAPDRNGGGSSFDPSLIH
jgi:FkbM family methyltransferase